MKHLTTEGISLHENTEGRWLVFQTKDGSSAALNIAQTFNQNRVVHEVIRNWAQEQTEKA